MLSDDEYRKTLRPRPRRAISDTKRNWSDSQKLEAIQMYLLTGSNAITCAALKIPIPTFKFWKNTQWWKDMVAELRVQDDLKLSARLQKIVDHSLTAVEDRLDKGEFFVDKFTGELRRKPVQALTAHKIASDMMDRRDTVLNRHLEGNTISEDKIQKTLENLAESFKKIANQQRGNVEVTDVIIGEMKDAVHEGRKEGLQNGVQEVPLQAGTDQETVRTDSSTPSE